MIHLHNFDLGTPVQFDSEAEFRQLDARVMASYLPPVPELRNLFSAYVLRGNLKLESYIRVMETAVGVADAR